MQALRKTPQYFLSLTALVVDDDEDIRDFVCDILSEAGFETIAAPDGIHAMKVAHEYSGRVHLLVTDQQMPGVTGKTLVDVLQRSQPGLRSLLISGSFNQDEITEKSALNSGILIKPFSREQLLEKIERLFDSKTES